MNTKTKEQVLINNLRKTLKTIMQKELEKLLETLEVLDPKEWIIKNQLGRRNLTEQEASYYRGKLYESRKQHQYIHPKSEDKNCPRTTTAEQIGKEYGVHANTVKRDAEFSNAVDKVAEEVGEEAKRANPCSLKIGNISRFLNNLGFI